MKAKGRANYQLPLTRLKSFLDHLKRMKRPWIKYCTYVKNIIDHYDEIILLKPSEFEVYYNQYFNGLSEKELEKSVFYKDKCRPFYEWLVYCMRYDEARSKKLIQYIRLMGIKTCVYCNAQYATTFVSDDETFAIYDLDHVWPKSKYPFLCTSFFNLVPSCPYCNKLKSDNGTVFNLYTEDWHAIEPFRFVLDKESIIRYFLSNHSEDLVVKMTASDAGNTIVAAKYNEQLHIDQRYSTHTDVVEELIWKSRIYNESYRQQLQEAFDKLFPDANVTLDFERLYKGYYTAPSDVHKRPLTKMLQDIGSGLGL